MTNKIKALCAIRGITQQELAEKLNTPQSNLSKKYKKDNWKESDLQEIAEILNADFKGSFILRDTNEQVWLIPFWMKNISKKVFFCLAIYLKGYVIYP